MVKKPASKLGKQSKVSNITKGLLSTTVDLLLVSLFYGLEFAVAGYGRGGKANKKALENLEEFNYASIKRALKHLHQKGLTQTVKERHRLPLITEEGKRRLKAIIPQYDDKRVWDSRIYLVTYDLPRERNSERDRLREFLKKIGCGMLQHSVWLTPYNPKELIEKFIIGAELDHELIIVSSLGKDGTVGDMGIEELLEKVYNLSELNEKYQRFILEAGSKEMSVDKFVFSYLAILREDPQLPFELLPENWLGDHAYCLFYDRTKARIKTKS